MAQQQLRQTEAVTLVGIESAYGTTPGTMKRVQVISKSFEEDRKRTQIEVEEEMVDLYDYLNPIEGLNESGCGFQCLVKPHGTQLIETATGFTTPGALEVAKAIFGGEQVAAGSLVVGSPAPTTTTFSVTATQGSRFAGGQLALVEQGGTLHCRPVATVVGDAITLAIALPGAPSTGAKVVNMFNVYPDPGNTKSVTVQRRIIGDAEEQYEWNGCTGDLEVTLERNTAMRFNHKLKAAKFRGPTSAIGAPGTYEADAHRIKGFAIKDATLLLQDPTLTTSTHYTVEQISIALVSGMEHQPDHGGVEGTASVMRLSGRPFLEATLTIPWDRTMITNAINRTPLRLFYTVPSGSGLTKCFAALHCPKGIIHGEPMTKGDNKRLMELKYRAQIDPTLATTLLKSPAVFATG